jgi:hypothetical protein
MTTHKKPAPLRDQIIACLTKREEANLKQIVAATTERDFPSRVTNELNKLRADAVVECAKKKGKNELWYWLSQPATNADASVPQPAVGDNTGSRVAASMPPAADATVQPEPAPAATAPSTVAPVAEDDSMSDGTRVLLNNLETQIAKVRSVIRDGARIRLCDVGDTVLARISHLEDAVGDMRRRAELAESHRDSHLAARDELRRELDQVRAQLAPHVGGSLAASDISEAEMAKKVHALIHELRDAHREQLNMIAIASETLAEVVNSAIDTSDMDIHELAKTVVGMLVANRECMDEQTSGARTDMRDVVSILAGALPADGPEPRDMHPHEIAEAVVARLANQTALVEKLEHLLQSARNEAEHLRRHANHSGDAADMVNHPPHYQGKVECIDAIEAALGAEGFVAYCRGNALKYSFRAGRKGDAVQDIQKARWYADRALQAISPTAAGGVPA